MEFREIRQRFSMTEAWRLLRRATTSIRWKLMFGLTVIGFLPAVAAGSFLFYQQRSSLLEDRQERLSAIGNVQRSRVLAWVDASEQSMALTASRTQLRIQLARLQQPELVPQDRAAAKAQITTILLDAADATGGRVSGVHALNREGVIVASTSPSQVGEDHGDQPYVTEPTVEQPSMSTLRSKRINGVIALTAIHGGVVELGVEVVGIVVLEQNLAPLLLVVGDYTGLGETGESVLVANDSDGRIISLLPQRHRPEAALSELPTSGHSSQPAALALGGAEVELSQVVDYRGEEVIAVTRPIERLGWGLVLKQDRSEVVADVHGLRSDLLLLAAGAAALMSLAGWITATRASRHIEGLTIAARRVARGDRDARAPVETKDELAELAVAFNVMTDQLVIHESELETRRDQLESVLYVASHDLKTPLRSVSSFGQILRLDYGPVLDARGQHYLERIEDGATRTIEVIDDLMAYVRIDHNHHELDIVDLSDSAQSAVELLGSLIAEQGAEVTVSELGQVHGNNALLVQLFQNLIGNAVKFCPPDRQSVVHVSARLIAHRTDSGENQLEVLVADNGDGIPEEFRKKVFAPFERLHGADEVAGTGLGLALCHRIVRLHGGSIDVVDGPLGGAVMRVVLRSENRSLRSGSTRTRPLEKSQPRS